MGKKGRKRIERLSNRNNRNHPLKKEKKIVYNQSLYNKGRKLKNKRKHVKGEQGRQMTERVKRNIQNHLSPK